MKRGTKMNVIETLSAQLGTTDDKLWDVLISQAYLSGATNLLVCVILIAMTAAIFLVLQYHQKKEDCDEDILYLFWALWTILAMIIFVVVCVMTESIVAAFVNPEYWALNKILGAIKY